MTLLAAISFAVTVNTSTVNQSLWTSERSNEWWMMMFRVRMCKLYRLHLRLHEIQTQCVSDYLQMWFGRSDHSLIIMFLHLACIFSYLDNLFRYRCILIADVNGLLCLCQFNCYDCHILLSIMWSAPAVYLKWHLLSLKSDEEQQCSKRHSVVCNK